MDISREPKRCENCRKVMLPGLMKNGKPEAPSAFKRKRFCSRICGGVAHAAQRKLEACA